MSNNTVLGVLDNKCVVPIEPFYTYTHTKSGTIHALSGNFGSNIKFIATADYIKGDTFTVNGTPVTSKQQNGNELETDSFVSGAVVTCFLNGTTLYFSSTSENAVNDITPLFSGTFSDMSYAQLSESVYNFLFIVIKTSDGKYISIPIIPNATSVSGTTSMYTAEAYDTYMFSASITNSGNVIADNLSKRATTMIGNPASVTLSSYTISAIYGLCRKSVNDITTLFTGSLSDMSYAQLSESVYNFLFIVAQTSNNKYILMPIISNAASVSGTTSEYTAEAYDTYTFITNIDSNGSIQDNRNAKITTMLGNPASVSSTPYTISAIYGLCRRA